MKNFTLPKLAGETQVVDLGEHRVLLGSRSSLLKRTCSRKLKLVSFKTSFSISQHVPHILNWYVAEPLGLWFDKAKLRGLTWTNRRTNVD